jgi:hypothetical protein
MRTITLSEIEVEAMVEYLDQALAEMEQDSDISQGCIDGLIECKLMLGVKSE